MGLCSRMEVFRVLWIFWEVVGVFGGDVESNAGIERDLRLF